MSSPKRRVELRSDTFTLPSPRMLEAMVAAELGDDVYGEDPTVNALEVLAARLLGKEAACFMPSGTMSNLASIMTHCPRGSKVIVGEESDIYVYEAGGASVCGGVIYHPIPNKLDGTMDLDAIAAAFPPDSDDPQFALPALLCLENPQNHRGGKVLPAAYLREVTDFARENGLTVHMDGSRIFNAALAADVPVAELAGYADSVMFCLSKGLGAPVGSMAVGTGPFIRDVRRLRKMLGGGMRQAGVLAAAAIVALENSGRLAEDHESARRLADGLDTIPGIAVDRAEPGINMVFFRVLTMDNPTFVAAAQAQGVALAELGHGQIRAVTHYGVEPEDIGYVLDVIRSILADSTRRSHADHKPVLAG
ncbi:low-specificity L-threonine aldolase [Nonomuraea sp. NPDC050547]|uniref:low-specificity L-threonine aldolase n=1 Tax=unclassified Nonomuraea TaxID=2593643 RepID=UPI0037B91966